MKPVIIIAVAVGIRANNTTNAIVIIITGFI